MSNQQISNLDRRKYTYTATGLFVIGAILFVIGAGLLFLVSKDELDEELTEGNDQDQLFI